MDELTSSFGTSIVWSPSDDWKVCPLATGEPSDRHRSLCRLQLLGLLVCSADAMQGIGFAMMIPLSFLAGTSVPIQGMAGGAPGRSAQRDPISAFVAATRQGCRGTKSTGSWPLRLPARADQDHLCVDWEHRRALP